MTDKERDRVYANISKDMISLSNKLSTYSEDVTYATLLTILQHVCEKAGFDEEKLITEMFVTLTLGGKENEDN